MDDKLIGFLYAAAGAILALLGKWAIDALTRRSERSGHRAYLCVRVVCELDRFAMGCLAVALDYGPDEHEGSSDITSVPQPSFEPHGLPVDWKSIDVKVAYEILNLPGEQAAADARISGVWRYDDADGDDTMDTRREEYRKLGLKAARLSVHLRQVGKLPPMPDLLTRLEDLEREAKEREAQQAERLKNMPMPPFLPRALPDA